MVTNPDNDIDAHKRAFAALAATIRRERRLFHWSVVFVALGILCAAVLAAYLGVRTEIDRKTDLLQRYALEVGQVVEREEFLVRRLGLTIQYYFSSAGDWEKGRFDDVIGALGRSERAHGHSPSDRAAAFLILFPHEGRAQSGDGWRAQANAVANSAASGMATLESLNIPRQAYLVGLEGRFAAVFAANRRGSYAEADSDPSTVIQTLRKKRVEVGRTFQPAGVPHWKYMSTDRTASGNELSCVGIVDAKAGGPILFGTDISASSLFAAMQRSDEYGIVGLYSPDGILVEQSVAGTAFGRGAAKVLPHPASGQPYVVREGVYLVEPVGNGFGYLVYGFGYAALLDAVLRSVGWVLAVSVGLVLILLACAWQWDRRVLRRKLVVSTRAIENEILDHVLVSAMPVGLLIVRADDYSVLRVDPRTATLLGMRGSLALPPPVEAEFRARVAETGRSASAIAHFDVQVQTGQQAASFLHVAYASSNHNGEALLICGVIDVTGQKQAELALARARDDADRQLRARSNFFAAVSHEIRTPLSAILGNIDLLEVERMSDAGANRLDAVRASAVSLLRIVTDILDLSRIDAGEMKLVMSRFNPHQCLERIARQYVGHAISKRLEFQLIAAPAMARYTVTGDPNRIAQIVDNLLGNAFKFTAAGRVAVRSSLVVEQAASATWAIDVVDSGCGIDEPLASRVFTPFAQADDAGRRHGGTGLGLSICSTLCELMGGTISLKSIPHVGSVFSVRLPVAVVEHRAANVRVPIGRALLVGEMSDYVRNLQAWLNDWGWNVSLASPDDVWSAWSAADADVIVLIESSANRVRDVAGDTRVPVVAVCQTTAVQPVVLSSNRIQVSAYNAGALREVLLRVSGRVATRAYPVPDDTDDMTRVPRLPGRDGGRGLTVLVVDDSRVNRELLADQAVSLGCRVLTAESGADALSMVRHNAVDVVLTDLELPGMSGAELLDAVRAEQPGLPVVAVSAYDLDGQIEMRLAQGFVDYLAKPVSLDRLSLALERFRVPHDEVGLLRERPVAGLTTELSAAEKAQLRTMFSSYVQDDIRELEALREARNPRGIERWLHRMRGTLLALGEHGLAGRCSGLERILSEAEEWKPEWASTLDDIASCIGTLCAEAGSLHDRPGNAEDRSSGS
ncbi:MULTISPECIES: hybrid sensor histidine kinase/response regulator [unclassified Burkholderia]|uniref:hybrid sensor histidine kinase/response regulator n=1 Tax=unclassified Burkholderia TaxID=2613784 RepID=UPI002ABD9ED8|nr:MULTISPECIES: ATP-binding protein [unclassified Burkholderia]